MPIRSHHPTGENPDPQGLGAGETTETGGTPHSNGPPKLLFRRGVRPSPRRVPSRITYRSALAALPKAIRRIPLVRAVAAVVILSLMAGGAVATVHVFSESSANPSSAGMSAPTARVPSAAPARPAPGAGQRHPVPAHPAPVPRKPPAPVARKKVAPTPAVPPHPAVAPVAALPRAPVPPPSSSGVTLTVSVPAGSTLATPSGPVRSVAAQSVPTRSRISVSISMPGVTVTWNGSPWAAPTFTTTSLSPTDVMPGQGGVTVAVATPFGGHVVYGQR